MLLCTTLKCCCWRQNVTRLTHFVFMWVTRFPSFLMLLARQSNYPYRLWEEILVAHAREGKQTIFAIQQREPYHYPACPAGTVGTQATKHKFFCVEILPNVSEEIKPIATEVRIKCLAWKIDDGWFRSLPARRMWSRGLRWSSCISPSLPAAHLERRERLWLELAQTPISVSFVIITDIGQFTLLPDNPTAIW